jgi:hypothetical protein
MPAMNDIAGFVRRLAIAFACALGPAGCGGESIHPAPLPEEPEVEVTVPELADGWNEIVPGGDTICSRGTDYAYWVHPGTVNRVVIDFVGGGACWNASTCGFADAIFTPDVEGVRAAVGQPIPGIYDRANPENPFRDWYHVVIPYCTGDVHWGDAVTTYGEGDTAVTIHHKGAVNTRAILQWVYDNFSAPEHIVVTGCSAGSYGSAMWAPHLMQHYPKAQVTQFGDSGAGIITQTFFMESFPSWNAEQAFPTWIPELNPESVDVQQMQLTDLYVGVANHYPDHRLSQYDTAFDENQTFYFTVMGGEDATEWSAKMYASIAEIEERTDNFAAFIPAGEQHCIILYENFYTVNVGGVRLVDWLNEMLERGPVQSEKCTDCSGATP